MSSIMGLCLNRGYSWSKQSIGFEQKFYKGSEGAKEKDNVSRLTNSTFLRSNALRVMEADPGGMIIIFTEICWGHET